jgi:hypothetical protein
MSFDILRYRFEGGFSSLDQIKDKAGVYLVFSKNGDSGVNLDAGEAGEVQSRLKNHERATCWQRHKNGTIYYAVHYTPSMRQSERMCIEKELRDHLRPTCGDR